MSRFFFFLLFLLIGQTVRAQVITVEPEFPTRTQSIMVTFYAKNGNAALEGFTGDVYAHTGLLTSESTSPDNWRYVKAAWEENSEATKMTRIAEDTFQLEITPSISEYYGVPKAEEIQKLAFVFRSADRSIVARADDGGDIFYDVYQEGLQVKISAPKYDAIADLSTTLTVTGTANEADSLVLFLNKDRLLKQEGTLFEAEVTLQDTGYDTLFLQAYNQDETVSDSVRIYVKSPTVEQKRPAGWHKGVNYLTSDSVGVVLYAPYKEFVYLLGDFNQWTLSEAYQMRKDGDYFWIPLGNLNPQGEYSYQFYINGTLRIADPYTELILDPVNDKYISNATYPDLPNYPTGKTDGIVGVFTPQKEPFQWKHAQFTPPAREKLTIYELLLRDFIEDHTFETLTDTLAYLDELGVNAIELMPFSEFEGNESWGYNPSFYFAPDKYYGPAHNLKAFVDSCHGRGIAVIMDLVLNHSYGQSPMVQMYFDSKAGDYGQPNALNPWYNQESPNSTYSWGFDFNHESAATQEFVDSTTAHWLNEYKIDGFRFDFTKGFTNKPGDGWAYDASRIAILKRMADEIWQENPEAYVILEHLTDNSEEKVLEDYGMLLWGNMNHEYAEATMGYSSDLSGTLYTDRGWKHPHLVSYMESHDEERLMFKARKYGNASETSDYDIKDIRIAMQRMELSANFFFTLPGPKMMWQFGELGYDYSIDYECRVCNKPIRWDYFEDTRRNRIYEVYSKLLGLREQYEVFHTRDFTLTQQGDLKVLTLIGDNEQVVVVGNFGVNQLEETVSFPTTGTWYELYGNVELSLSDSDASLALEPGEYRLYSTVEMGELNLPTDRAKVKEKGSLSIFPNPIEEQVWIDGAFTNGEPFTVTVQNMSGQQTLAKTFHYQGAPVAIPSAEWAPGLYLISVYTQDQTWVHKVIK
ncbi:MAG: alpha-amylase family glycosyl hydrolase [Bacteroidota bacterium]